MSVLLSLQGKDLRQLLRHLTSSSQLFGSPSFFLRINLSPTIRYPTHFSSSILRLEMESTHTHTHQSFPCTSEIKNPWFAGGCLLLKTENQTKSNQISTKKDPNPNIKSPLNAGTILTMWFHFLQPWHDTGKPCEHATCSVPFKEMVGSSSCRCLLLVGPPKKCWFQCDLPLSCLFCWGNVYCKKIARSQHLAKYRVLFCPIRWATKTHQTNFTTSILCNHKKDLEQRMDPLLPRVLCFWSSSSSSCFLFVVSCSFLIAPLVGEPQLFMAVAVEIAIDLHHTLVKPRAWMLRRGVDSLIRSKGVLETCHETFFISSKLGNNILKTTKKQVWSNFPATKNRCRITFDDWKKGVCSLSKNNKNELHLPPLFEPPKPPPSLCGTSTASLRNECKAMKKLPWLFRLNRGWYLPSSVGISPKDVFQETKLERKNARHQGRE